MLIKDSEEINFDQLLDIKERQNKLNDSYESIFEDQLDGITYLEEQRYIFEVDNTNNIVWECHTGANLGFFDYPLRCNKIESEIFNKTNYNLKIVNGYNLLQNYPNPFNPITTVQYDLPEDGLVNITIYDMMGRVVKNLISSQQNSGYKSVRWNATNNENQSVSAGSYFYSIEAGDFKQTKKMILVK